MKIRVLVVDNDINSSEAVKQNFGCNLCISVDAIFNNKESFLSYKEPYDVVIVNMLLNNNDVYDVLDNIKSKNKKVIVTSEFVSNEMMDCLNTYKPNYFLIKPYSFSTLERVILSVVGDKDESDNELKVDITNLLHSLGIPSHIKGYNYIRDGIQMVIKNSNKLGSMTKNVYPSIASNYDTTSSRVERAIRHAIEVSWMRGDYSLMEEIFGNSIDYDRSKPTNSEFIATLADRLVLNKNYI